MASTTLHRLLSGETNGRVIIQKINDSEAGGLTSVKNDEFFHGYIPNKQTPGLLVKEGDFLVRQPVKAETRSSQEKFVISIRREESKYVLKDHEEWYTKNKGQPDMDQSRIVPESAIHKMPEVEADLYVMVEEGIGHYAIKYSRRARLYYINGYGFTYISGLIDYHKRKKISVDPQDSTALLKKPIKRAWWQFNHEQIHRQSKLGDGAFGEVFKGQLRLGLISTKGVAVKTISGTITSKDNEELFQEAMLMQRMDHPNIVRLYGVASNEDPVMIVMELCCGGSVLDTIRKKSPTIAQKIDYVFGAAKGLQYLADKGIVHRDLAARNTLLGKRELPKISDFGLSITGGQKKEKKLSKVPMRYLAPQTLRHATYNLTTDVWSFGIYMWEVFNNGPEQPYPTIESKEDVKAFVCSGKRLGPGPFGYPVFLWDLTKQCWTASSKKRITIGGIVDAISAEDDSKNGSWFQRRFGKKWKDVTMDGIQELEGWMAADLDEDKEEEAEWKKMMAAAKEAKKKEKAQKN